MRRSYARGLYHEKAGIFTDAGGHHVAFSGSSNETAGGLLENFESIKAFCSWKDPEGRVQEELDNFEALWADSTPGLQVLEFSAVSRELLERYRNTERPPPGMNPHVAEQPTVSSVFQPPANFSLRPYQEDAIRAWSKAGGRGIFAMATGTGKTPTALALASKVAERNKALVVIVVCPFINLCRQWIREMASFGVTPVAAFEGRDRWVALLEEGYQRLSVGLSQVHAIVATNATFMSERFTDKGRQSPEEQKLHSIAQRLLLLERDLKAPGASRSSDERVDRILEAIAKERF